MSLTERTKKRLKTSEKQRLKNGRTKTVGQIAFEEMQKEPDTEATITDYRNEALKHYMDNLYESVDLHKKIYNGDFYVVVTTKREALMQNVIRNYFTARESCPTPAYDQSVFLFKRTVGTLDYLWTIPNKFACLELVKRRLEIGNDEKELLEMVLRFASGDLMRLCLKLNNETSSIQDVRSADGRA